VVIDVATVITDRGKWGRPWLLNPGSFRILVTITQLLTVKTWQHKLYITASHSCIANQTNSSVSSSVSLGNAAQN
jgi:hypothetical protein